MEIDLAKLDGVRLTRGSHEDISEGMCVMEAVAYLTGGLFTDFPSCTPVEVTKLAQMINDGYWESDEERTETLVPLIPLLASCERSEAASRIRAFMCADMARLWVADAIEVHGFKSEAEEIRSLQTIAEAASATSARDLVLDMRQKIYHQDASYAIGVAFSVTDLAVHGGPATAAAYAYDAAGLTILANPSAVIPARIGLLVAMCQVRT